MDSEESRTRRKQPRYNCVSRIRYVLHKASGAGEHEGLMLNMSSSGLCLSMNEPLEVGQEISITQCVASFCCRTYRVQWIVPDKEEAESYTAGLMAPEYNIYQRFS